MPTKLSIFLVLFTCWSSVQADTKDLLNWFDRFAQAQGLETPVAASQQDSPRVANTQIFFAADIDQVLIPADQTSGLPEKLHGLWWMDGNPVADEVVSFGLSTWDENKLRTEVPVYASGNWSWHDSRDGYRVYRLAKKFKLTYRFEFNEAVTFAQITPVLHLGPIQFKIPRFIANFTMEFIADGHWVRKTRFFGRQAGDYNLRRITNGLGLRESTYQDFVNASPSTLFIPL